MRFGAVFPTTEIGTDPIVIRDFAQTAEGLGYARLTAYDHVLGAEHSNREPPLNGPYTPDDQFHEPMVLFGYLAAHTTQIELATGVMVLPQRQTVLVAKQAAEVDLLSGGRVVLGVGSGWNHVEYTALGTTFRDRARRLEEQVEVLRALWSQDVVDIDGSFHRIERAGLNPLPPSQIPIWMGGSSNPALARSARIGDGHIFGHSGDRIVTAATELQTLLVDQGRDPHTFGMEAIVDYGYGPDVWREETTKWAGCGGTLLSLRAMSTAADFLRIPPPQFTSPQQHIVALERFIKEVGGL
jgi:probable F420-dependent oxidoreductase